MFKQFFPEVWNCSAKWDFQNHWCYDLNFILAALTLGILFGLVSWWAGRAIKKEIAEQSIKPNRLEVIDNTGRVFIFYGDFEQVLQDNRKTLKIFINGKIKK